MSSVKTNPESSKEARVGTGVARVLEALQGLSSMEAIDVLKAVGAMRNLRVQSAFQATVTSASAGIPRKSGTAKPSKGKVPSGTKSEEAKAIQAQITALNVEIKAKAKGERLPDDHELIVKRNDLFRSLKKAKSG